MKSLVALAISNVSRASGAPPAPCWTGPSTAIRRRRARPRRSVARRFRLRGELEGASGRHGRQRRAPSPLRVCARGHDDPFSVTVTSLQESLRRRPGLDGRVGAPRGRGTSRGVPPVVVALPPQQPIRASSSRREAPPAPTSRGPHRFPLCRLAPRPNRFVRRFSPRAYHESQSLALARRQEGNCSSGRASERSSGRAVGRSGSAEPFEPAGTTPLDPASRRPVVGGHWQRCRIEG